MALALGCAAAASAQGLRSPPARQGPDPAASTGAGAAGTPELRAPGGSPGAGGADGLARDVSPSGAHPAPGPPASPSPVGLEASRGGGDAAPVCRTACAADLYRCLSAAVDDTCHAVSRTCRADCETTPQPPGRLVSPLPDAGLAPAAALRPLPGGLPAPAPRP